MPNNLIVGPNVAIAIADKTFTEAGVTTLNTKRITKVGVIPKSFDPNRTINSLTKISEDDGLYIEMLQTVKLVIVSFDSFEFECNVRYFFISVFKSIFIKIK